MEIHLERAQRKLGEVIRTKRKELGHSQEELATNRGIHRTYMGAVERGERNLSLLNILRISKALKVKASELLALAKL